MQWSEKHECWIINPTCDNCTSPKAKIPNDQTVRSWIRPEEFCFRVECVRCGRHRGVRQDIFWIAHRHPDLADRLIGMYHDERRREAFRYEARKRREASAP